MGRRRTYRDFEFIKRRFAPSGALGCACDINIRTSLIQLKQRTGQYAYKAGVYTIYLVYGYSRYRTRVHAVVYVKYIINQYN